MNETFESFVSDELNNYKIDEINEDTLKLDDPRLWVWLSRPEKQGVMNEDFVDFFTI